MTASDRSAANMSTTTQQIMHQSKRLRDTSLITTAMGEGKQEGNSANAKNDNLDVQKEKHMSADKPPSSTTTKIEKTISTSNIPTIQANIGSSKPKVLFHLVRHGEAAHNIVLDNDTACAMFDPELTPFGEKQCMHLRDQLPEISNVSLILCSPLLRTRQTAELAFRPLLDQGLKIHLWDLLKEWGGSPCNSGLGKDELVKEVDGDVYEFGMLAEDWAAKTEPRLHWVDRADAPRSKQVKQELHDLSKVLVNGGEWQHLKFARCAEERDVEVAIVSHGSFLSTLCRFSGQQFFNAEFKTVTFPSKSAIEEYGSQLEVYDLVETRQSRAKVYPRLVDPGAALVSTSLSEKKKRPAENGKEEVAKRIKEWEN